MSGYQIIYFRLTWVFALFFCICSAGYAQRDTLPDFSVVNLNGVIQISWHNPFKNISQINIQRSKERNKNFSTIHTLPNPSVKYYQYQDKTAKTDSGYYRVFILFEGSNYQFTKAIRAGETTGGTYVSTVTYDPPKKVTENKDSIQTVNIASSVNKKDSLKISALKEKLSTYPKYLRNILSRPIPPAPVITTNKKWEPSRYVFTGDDGNIVIAIPDAGKKNYTLTLLKEEGRPLFRIPKITQSSFTLDKTTFLKSGWYYFELRESGKVVERNKFLITRDN